MVNDEMDICTTPPHESSVQFEEVSVGVVVNAQPPLPLTPLLQPPLPPPQDNGDCGEPRVKPPLPPTAVPTEVCTVDMIAAYPQIPTMTNSAGLAWNGMLPVAVAAPMVCNTKNVAGQREYGNCCKVFWTLSSGFRKMAGLRN